ncbi:MAG: hypothetical protein R2685_10675 [Candidatus Nitrosocosmicus sp.]|nr:hypothetical protein [Candidatus Nitrosocosmicus sp.]
MDGDVFESATGIKATVSNETALSSELERDIYKFLSGFTESKEFTFPYIEQLSKMITTFQDSGYLSYLINFKELPDNLQDYLHGNGVFEGFLESVENVVKFMLYEYHRDFVEEYTKESDFNKVKSLLPRIKIRLRNFKYELAIQDVSEIIPVRALKSAFSDKLQTITGVAISVSHVESTISTMAIECDNCDYVYVINFNKSGQLRSLDKTECSMCEGGKLHIVETKVDDVQIITLQDINDATTFNTSTPISLICKVDQELTNKIQIGDAVVATGLLKLKLDDKDSKSEYNQKVKNNDYYNQLANHRSTVGSGPKFPRVFDVNYIEVNRIDDFSNYQAQIDKIRELQKRPDLYELLLKSFCPQIYGHEAEKEGILLALVGGVGRNTTGGKIDKRGNSHVMMISDPSVGKSELLKYTSKLMSRGLYVSATSSTKVGLTGSVRNDKETGKYMIEAGGILRANGSVLCIDEIGKLDPDSQAAIYEVAEQETYTLAKAGIVKTFDVNITLIVGGNPRDGRYNPTITTAQNLQHFAAPFLSRFDAKYLLRDMPGDEDEDIAYHVLKQTNGEFDSSGLIPFELLACYIMYHRNHGLAPKLTKEAMKYLAEYYKGERKNFDPNDPASPAPISVRELEGIDRMCKAKARLLNREWVEIEDVKAIIKTHESMIYKLAYDQETQQVDRSLLNNAKTAGQMSKFDKIKELALQMIKQDPTGRVDTDVFIKACQSQDLGSKESIKQALNDMKGQKLIKYMENEYIELKE